MKHLKGFNELSSETYSKLMSNTDSYPITRNNGNIKLADKKENVNKIARESFLRNFYKEFPKNSKETEVDTNQGTLTFYDLKFQANYTNYHLLYKDTSGRIHEFTFGNDNEIYDCNVSWDKGKDIKFYNNSEDKLKRMLQYNTGWKK